jgi:hypothetical protein
MTAKVINWCFIIVMSAKSNILRKNPSPIQNDREKLSVSVVIIFIRAVYGTERQIRTMICSPASECE